MTIKQLSVFVENKAGTLVKVLRLIADANIHIIASTTPDTVDFGIARIICTEPRRAFELLKEAGVSVALSDVFVLVLPNETGAAASAIERFADAGINLTYIYSFLLRGKGILIFRTDNPDKTREVIVLDRLQTTTELELLQM